MEEFKFFIPKSITEKERESAIYSHKQRRPTARDFNIVTSDLKYYNYLTFYAEKDLYED